MTELHDTDITSESLPDIDWEDDVTPLRGITGADLDARTTVEMRLAWVTEELARERAEKAALFDRIRGLVDEETTLAQALAVFKRRETQLAREGDPTTTPEEE